MKNKSLSKYLRLDPRAKIKAAKIKKGAKVKDLVLNNFQGYNAARLNEACRLFAEKMLAPKNDTTICLTLAGALTPVGLGGIVIQLMEKGFIDFIISTGANLYHDMHFAFKQGPVKGDFRADDVKLDKEGIVRIYDTFLPRQSLLDTDAFLREFCLTRNFGQDDISTAEFHYELGRKLWQKSPYPKNSLVAMAHKYNVPLYCSSPGDSTLGMDLAALQFEGSKKIHINPSLDINETAALVWAAKKNGAILLGGGSPKNFYMQTQPMLWEIYHSSKGGHDFFVQITTDAPQWGGLSGATPQEAVSWGKINPNEIKNTVVVYSDATIAAPILFAYALDSAKTRKRKELYSKRQEFVGKLKKKYKGIIKKHPEKFFLDYNIYKKNQ